MMNEQQFLVVGLTEDGDEIDRVIVTKDKLEEAKHSMRVGADWVDVIKLPMEPVT